MTLNRLLLLTFLYQASTIQGKCEHKATSCLKYTVALAEVSTARQKAGNKVHGPMRKQDFGLFLLGP